MKRQIQMKMMAKNGIYILNKKRYQVQKMINNMIGLKIQDFIKENF